MWQCHVNSIKILKRTLQNLRRKAAIKAALFHDTFHHFRRKCTAVNWVWKLWIKELHQCIHTGSITEESSVHAQHCESTVHCPEHRCQEHSHSTNCTTWWYHCNASWEKQGSQLGIRQPRISPVSLMPLKAPWAQRQLLATELRHRALWRANHSNTPTAHRLLLSNAPCTTKYRSGVWKSSLPLQILNRHAPAYAITPKILRVKQLCPMALPLPCSEWQQISERKPWCRLVPSCRWGKQQDGALSWTGSLSNWPMETALLAEQILKTTLQKCQYHFEKPCSFMAQFSSKWLYNYICECNPVGYYSNYRPQSFLAAFREIICVMKWRFPAAGNKPISNLFFVNDRISLMVWSNLDQSADRLLDLAVFGGFLVPEQKNGWGQPCYLLNLHMLSDADDKLGKIKPRPQPFHPSMTAPSAQVLNVEAADEGLLAACTC